MKLEIPVKVYFNDVQDMIDEIKKLQTYKLVEGDTMVLVDLDAVVTVMANHVKADEYKADKYSESPNNSDTISRQQAVDEIRKCRFVVDAIEKIRALPSAKPECKKGKWNTYYHSDTDFTYSCNRCGYSAPYQMIGGEVFQKKWNYCPNCGTKMEDGYGDNNTWN